jgi:hypothetical protein
MVQFEAKQHFVFQWHRQGRTWGVLVMLTRDPSHVLQYDRELYGTCQLHAPIHKITAQNTLKVTLLSIAAKPKQAWQEWYGHNLESVPHKVSAHHLYHEWQQLAAITAITAIAINFISSQHWCRLVYNTAQNSGQTIIGKTASWVSVAFPVVIGKTQLWC